MICDYSLISHSVHCFAGDDTLPVNDFLASGLCQAVGMTFEQVELPV